MSTVVGERLNARAKDKHAKQSAPEETVPKKTRREKFGEQLTNQSVRRNRYDRAES